MDKAKAVTVEQKSGFDWSALKSKVESEHWKKLRVTIRLRDKMHAGKPAQLNAANAMLKARGLEEVVEAREIERPTEERAEEVVEEGLCEFHRREGKLGIWWPTNNFKACLKENWSVLGYRVDATPRSQRKDADEGKKRKPLQGSRAQCAEGMFVRSEDASDPDWIYLGESPDGIDQSVAHTMGPKGPQSSIKRNEYVRGREIVLQVWISQAGANKIPDESFADTLLHAQEHGIGANRSQGFGTFDVIGVEEL